MQVCFSPVSSHLRTILALALHVPLAAFGAQGATSGPAVNLTPDMIVSRLVSDSVLARELTLSVKAAEVSKEAARASLDTLLTAQSSQQWSKAESLGGPSVNSEQTFQASGQILQNLSTGTQLSYQYQTIHSEADVPATMQGIRSERSHLQSFTLGLTHDLWRNQNGSIVRQQLSAADKSVTAAQLTVKDSLSSYAAQVLELYWQAVALSNSIDELKASQDRFDELLRYSRERATFGLNEVGDSERIKADREVTRQRIVSTRALLDQLIARVATLLKLTPPSVDSVILELPTDLGARPVIETQQEVHLKIQQARTQLAAAEIEAQVAAEQTDPRLAAFARAGTSGVDPAVGGALEEMGTWKRPSLTVGLQFEMALDNFGAKAQLASKRIRSEQLRLQLERIEDEVKSQDYTLLRDAQAAWDLAQSAGEVVKLRSIVARDLRSAYRQGRLGLDQVILAINQQFLAEIERTDKITNYLRARDRLMAHRGQLLQHYTAK